MNPRAGKKTTPDFIFPILAKVNPAMGLEGSRFFFVLPLERKGQHD